MAVPVVTCGLDISRRVSFLNDDGKYHKPITVQYSIANCVCWVPRLTLLDLETGLETISLSCI